jgi:hypothetical protein
MAHEFEPLQNDLVLRTAWGDYIPQHNPNRLFEIANTNIQATKLSDHQYGLCGKVCNITELQFAVW